MPEELIVPHLQEVLVIKTHLVTTGDYVTLRYVTLHSTSR